MTKVRASLSLHPKQMEVYQCKKRFRVVVAGRRWGKCCKAGTLISMADGTYKRIEDVNAGDLILTINESTYALETKPVKHLHDNGVKETLTVITRSGKRLTITPNHPLLANNKWTEARHLKTGDLIAAPRVTTFSNEQMLAHELNILAIWLAEGRGYQISNTTPEILDVVRECALNFGGDLTVSSKNGIDWQISNGKRTGGPSVGSKNPMRLCLEKLSVWGLNSKTKFIPDEVFRLPKEQLAQFLNLFVACDGSINHRSNKTWAMEIGLANERMIYQLADLFLKFGIRGNISKKIHKAKSTVTGENFVSWRFIVSDSRSLRVFCEQIGALSKESKVAEALKASVESAGSANSYLPISHDDFVQHLNYEPKETGKYGGYNNVVGRDLPEALRAGLNSWRKQTSSRVSERRYEQLRGFSDGFYDQLADGDLVWDEIIAIEESGENQTYDLTVNGNHNFIANGLVTHNTALSRVLIIKRAQMPRQKIWYVAPTYRMAKQIMWTDLLEAIPPKWIRKINETTLSITLVNSTRIELKGADKADSLRGVGLNFLVLDEFQDMSQDTWTKVLRPTLADKQGDAIFIGTPKAYNYLYEVYKNGTRGEYYEDGKGRLRKNTWQSWQFPTITSPFIPLSEIESAKHDMDDKSFKQEFEACHLPETEVIMWSGKVKQIQHIEVGELVRHLSDDGVIEPCEVLAIGETGVKCVIDATLETGDVISASAHHKFKVHHESSK